MLVNLTEIFDYANENKIGVGAFNVPTLEMLTSVLDSAEALSLPVIIQHAEGHNKFISMEEMVNISRYYAEKYSIPVCVHLDHGTSFEMCKKAIDLGFTSVMFDGSMRSYDDNISITKQVVKYARTHNVSVEAELGFMLNSEVGAGEGVDETDETYAYTDPVQAKEFVLETRVDCLAIAAGTVHGLYLKEPKLNLDVIKEISDSTRIPLVLHGGSGLKINEYQTAIKNGVRKINYYTYMNKEAGEAIVEYLKNDREYVFFDELTMIAKSAMRKNITSFMKILSFTD